MKRRCWVVLLLMFAGYLHAQPPTTTTYVGTVKDLTGATVTSGRITWQLNAPQGGVIPGTGSFVSTTVSCGIDANGHPVSTTDGTSPCTVVNNTALTPTGTSYTMCTQPQFVSPGSCIVTFAPGGTVDISTVVPVPTTGPFNYAGTPGPPGPMATPSGTHGQVQINQSGVFGVAPSLTYDFTTDTLHTNNLNVSGTSNVIIPPTQVTWPASCATGTYVPASNTCVATGTASNPGGAAPQIQFNAGGTFAGIAGSSYSPTTGIAQLPIVASTTSPVADIRSQGAVIDGATPIDTALLAAVNVCNAANGNACSVLLPCGGPAGCFLSSGSVLPAIPSNKDVELTLQGTLHLGSTLVLPSGYSLIGKAGGTHGAFQSKNPAAAVFGASVSGTMGTAITVTGSSTTFTPTFTAGSAMPALSAITVAGLQTCTVSASRDSTIPSHQPNTTFTASACTASNGDSETIRIPKGALITVSGCSDSSFNITRAPINFKDWPNAQVGIYEAGASATATGCAIVGFDDNTYETERITAFSGGVATATFAHKHAATDVWGMVGIRNGYSGGSITTHTDLQGISVSQAPGMQVWYDNATVINMDSIATTPPSGGLAAGGFECDGCWWGQISNSLFVSGSVIGCTSNCTQPAYVYGIRCSQNPLRVNGIGCPNLPMYSVTILGGIKVDGNGMDNSLGVGPNIGPIYGVIFEQVADAEITVDNRFSLGGKFNVTTDGNVISDNFLQGIQYYVAATDLPPVNQPSTNLYADLGDLGSFNGDYLSNQYWGNGLTAKGPGYGAAHTINPGSTHTGAGVFNDGTQLIAHLHGKGDGLSPALITQATLPVTTATCGTCTAVPGPDGMATSATEIANAPAAVIVQVGTQTMATYPGDQFIIGARMKAGTGGAGRAPVGRLLLSTTAPDSFKESGSINLFVSQSPFLTDDGWSQAISVATILAGNSTPHVVKIQLDAAVSSTVNAADFYNWFWLFIPGVNNPAYAGITQQEVTRYAQTLFDSYVPGSMPAGGGLLAMSPAHKLYWGNDTNVYRSGTGVLKTDGTWDSTTTINSKAVCLSDGTNCPAAAANIPSWLGFLGDASESAPVCTSGCTAAGEHWYASLNVPAGQVMYASSTNPLVIRSTGTCTIAGSISVSVNTGSFPGNTNVTNWGGGGGGGGFGAANGAAGFISGPAGLGGAAGTTGVAGGNGTAAAAQLQKIFISGTLLSYSSQPLAGLNAFGGAGGGLGGSSGGAAGKGGGVVVIDCQTINFTGTIDASGQNGGAGGSNTGGGGGGGGGIVILRSPNMTNSGTINVAAGLGGVIGTGTSTAGGAGGAGWSKVFAQ